MSLNRRTFLTAAAAGLTASAAHALPVGKPEKWDEEFDIVIVGAGGAGLAAGSVAADMKLSAVILEKEPVVGGSSTICGGQWSVAGTEEQKKRDIADSEELFVKDMLTTGQNKNDPAIVTAFVKESKAMYEWVTGKLGVKPVTVTLAAGMSVPRAHTFNPSQIIQALKTYDEKNGVKIMTRMAAERLIWDDDAKCIAGVRAKRGSRTVHIRAKKGVLLASGGFSRSPELLAKYAPLLENAAVIAGLGTQGDGIKMAQAYGADMVDTPYIKASYGFTLKPSTIKDMSLIYYKGAIMVNKAGKRFVNESISYKLLADVAFAQPEGKSWLIFDDSIRKVAMKADPLQDGIMWRPIDEEGKVPPYVFQGATIEEAAEKAGLPAAEAAQAVKKYNDGIDAGTDEFGRLSLSSGYGDRVKIEKGPFYVFPSVGAMIGTYCGVKIDANGQVIDVFGEKIPHLYAAGEMTGGCHGAAYMTGTAFGKALSFGRIAARAIAGA